MRPTMRQIKAARALLGWNASDLAERAGIGVSTVRDFERGERDTEGKKVAAMVRALRENGVGFRMMGVVLTKERMK